MVYATQMITETQKQFPVDGVEMSVLLIVRDLDTARQFYRDVLGADEYREYEDTAVYQFQGIWLIVTVEGGPTEDKPDISMVAPVDTQRASVSLTMRVPDCQAAYDVLTSRGAQFVTPPHSRDGEIRCFFHDPDGHLFEISERT